MLLLYYKGKVKVANNRKKSAGYSHVIKEYNYLHLLVMLMG